MGSKSSIIARLRARPELWTLITYFLITAVTTGIGLLFRFVLLQFRGSHDVSILGYDTTININDNLAYTVYYASSVIVFYLWKWAISKEKKASSFLPRFLGFCALNGVSILAGNWLLSVLIGWGVNGEAAFWLTCPFTFLINYLGSRLVVFRDFDKQTAEAGKQLKSERAERDGGKE